LVDVSKLSGLLSAGDGGRMAVEGEGSTAVAPRLGCCMVASVTVATAEVFVCSVVRGEREGIEREGGNEVVWIVLLRLTGARAGR
jgi:hypothetical protein